MSAEDRPVVSALRDAKEAKAPGRKSRSLLPSPPPDPGAEREQVAAWLTVAFGLGADPIVRAERFGRHEDARMVIVLRSKQRVTFERQADAFDARRLVRVIVTATGAIVPPYAYSDALQLASAIVRLAETLADDDGRAEAAEWGRQFLDAARGNAIYIEGLDTPAGRYGALSALVSWTPPTDLPPYTPAAERAALIVDSAHGTRLLRVSAFAAHVRGLAGRPLSWPALHGRMVEVGWEHRGEVEQRQPNGHGRVKVHVYAVPGGWEGE